MHAKDFKDAFTFENRRPLFEDKILHVPDHYQEHHLFTLPDWKDPLMFGNSHPICIEICSGNGDWIIEKALSQENKNWIAVEKRFDRMRKIWAKIKNHNLSNLVGVLGEGFTFSSHYIKSATIDEVFINFPDPWPKKKHGKHRLMKASFIDQLARILKEEGTVSFVTDDAPYLESTIGLFLQNPCFKEVFVAPHYITAFENYGVSWFEKLWREKGKQIHYTQFKKVKCPLDE